MAAGGRYTDPNYHANWYKKRKEKHYWINIWNKYGLTREKLWHT